jgi:hypothetical protein
VRLRLITLAIAVAAAVTLAGPGGAHADDDPLRGARESFRRGEYQQVIGLVSPLLYPSARLSRVGDLVDAHLLLGVSHFELGARDAAAREFEEALYLDPELSLDTQVFSPGAVEFFERARAELDKRAAQEEEVRRLAEERDRYRRALENLVVIERRSYYVNFVPFGAGQFQNGHTSKGVAFFVSEALLGGFSAGVFVYQWQRYGFRGSVPIQDLGREASLQRAQVITGGLCLAVMAWGIVDALIHFEPTRVGTPDPSLLPEDFVPPQPGANAATRFHVAPTAHEGGAGLLFSWGF